MLWVFSGDYLYPPLQHQFVVFLVPPPSLDREEILSHMQEPTAKDPVTLGAELARLSLTCVIVLAALARVSTLTVLPRVQIVALLPRVQALTVLPRVHVLLGP